jgi:CheY-like chemotaxis protein
MKTILLIDDDSDFLFSTKSQLEQQGFKVLEADNKKDAIALLSEVKFDLVISDLMMENFDAGFEITYLAKKINPECPVIMVTNVTQEAGFKFNLSSEEEKDWIKADAILNKPIRFGQLMKEIQSRMKI